MNVPFHFTFIQNPTEHPPDGIPYHVLRARIHNQFGINFHVDDCGGF